jgi:nitroreductase
MEFNEVVSVRRSIRNFSSEPVEEEKLRAVLETLNRAPSAGNLQAYEVFLIRDAAVRQALSRASLSQEFVAQAPVVLVFCANPKRAARRYGNRGERLYAAQDATIACTFAMLAATAQGLSTTWVGAFNDHAVHEAIGSPEGIQPVAILPIGYAAENPGPTPRRRLADLIHQWPVGSGSQGRP